MAVSQPLRSEITKLTCAFDAAVDKKEIARL